MRLYLRRTLVLQQARHQGKEAIGKEQFAPVQECSERTRVRRKGRSEKRQKPGTKK